MCIFLHLVGFLVCLPAQKSEETCRQFFMGCLNLKPCHPRAVSICGQFLSRELAIWIRPPLGYIWSTRPQFTCLVSTPPRQRGGVSSISLSFNEMYIKTGLYEQSCFWQSKKGVVVMTIEHFNQSMSRTFMKTLKNHTNLWENVPFKVHALLII